MPRKNPEQIKEERRIETLRLALLAKEGDEDAVDDLCEILRPLMLSVFSHLSLKNIIMKEEIDSLGREAVISAIDPFDPEKSNNFGKYCYRWIRNSMEQEARNRIYSIRLPSSLHVERRRVMKVVETLRRELEREPTIEEIVERSDFSERSVKRIMAAPTLNSMSSLNDHVGDTSVQLHETIGDETASRPEDGVDFKIKIDYIEKIMEDVLDERQKDMINMFYGIGSEDGEGMTLSKIAEEYGITTERVRQILLRAVNQIKKVVEKDGETTR